METTTTALRPESAPSSHALAEPGAPSTPQTASTTRFSALQSANFKWLWFGLLISNAGTWMESVASGWLVTDLEPDRAAFWLGVLAISFAIPMLILPPFGGAVADRVHRIRLLWAVQVMYLVLSSALAIVTLIGVVEIWMLLVYAVLNGVVLAFDSPVRHALLPEILSREQLTSGVSLNSVAFTGAALVGPAIAGALIPLIGVGGVMTFNAVSCGATLIALSKLQGIAERPSKPSTEGVFQSIGRGVRFILASPLLSGLMLVSTVGGLFARSYNPLLAVFARDVYHVGSGAYGALVSAGGLGTLIGAFGLAGRRTVSRRGRLVAAAVLSQATFLLLFAVSPWFALSLPLLGLIGMSYAIAAASIATLIQLSAPNELRGRVMSLYMLTVIGVPSVGSFIIGAVGQWTGVRLAVGGSASIVLLTVSVILRRNSALRNAE
jgi:MFS family permease